MRTTCIASAVSLALMTSTTSFAQSESESIERIVVTSDFRAVTLEQLAASATVLDAETLASRQAQHIDEVLGAIPNVNFASGASRGRFIQIRGIGERSQFSEPLNSSVSFELDNIDFTGLFGVAVPFDIQQVEVLRGPQATEFGVGALAGAIKMTGTMPGEESENRALLSYGTQDTLRAGIAYGTSLSESTDARFSWVEQRSDGFIDNTFLNRDDTDNIDESAGRLAFRTTLSEQVSLLVNYRYFDIDNGYDAFSLDNDRRTRSDEPGFDRNTTHGASLTLEGQGASFDWLAIVSATDTELAYGYDEDWTFTDFSPNGYTSFDAYFRDIDSQRLEWRALSRNPITLGDQSVQWVVGAIYRTRDESLLREYTFASADFSSEYSPESTAVYARFDTAFDNAVNLQFGLRVERSSLEYRDVTGFVEDSSDTLVGGKLGLSVPVSNGLAYASISRGFKAGGFNPDERVTAEARIYEPEYNWNYEVGLKDRWFDGMATVRLAAFYMDRQDTQINDFDTLVRDNGSTDFIDVIANADVGTNAGIEFESNWTVTDNWQIDASFGYLRATFEDYQRADGSVVEKRDQAQAPQYTAHLRSTLMFDNDISWWIEVDGKDDYFFSDGHNEQSFGHAVVNTTVEWRPGDWVLQLWAKNLFDRDYYVRGFGGFSNDPRDGEFGYEVVEPYYQFGAQRQVGITAEWLF